MTDPLLYVQGVWFAYGDAPPALCGIDLRINRGEAIGLIGQNGSGKTTLAKHMNGLLQPDRGKVALEGRDTSEATTGELASVAGYVFQNPDHQIFSPTVDEEIAFGPANLGLAGDELRARVDDALTRFGLVDVRQRHPTLLGRGLRRRVAIASVYALQPRLIVLDEPTGGLDRRHALELLDLLRELVHEGRTVILISHDMRLIGEFADRLIVMRDGQIIADGSTRDLLTEEETLLQSGLMPPEVARLSGQLDGVGMKPSVRSSDFREQYRALYARRSRVRGSGRST